jgi:phospholipase C
MVGALLAACSDAKPVVSIDDASASGDDAGADASTCTISPCPATRIHHVVILIQENKTFDAYFGQYCQAPTGSSPTCNDGPACCEAAPTTDPGGGGAPAVLDDTENGTFDPSHKKACELEELNGGKMDRFVTASCGSPHHFAYASPSLVKPIRDLAAGGAIGDRYFQPVAGESAANDMYFARAQWAFDDNHYPKDALGVHCDALAKLFDVFTDATIGDLLVAKGVKWTYYAEGYARSADAKGACTPPPADCAAQYSQYPCDWDPSDDPFQFFPNFTDKAPYIADLTRLTADLAGGTLPEVSFVKALGYKTEHPGSQIKISDGMRFVGTTVAAIQGSPYASDTLILLTYDEGGGYFDHVAPPPTSAADQQPYGTRVPFIAIGPFARKGYVSHVTMEHASIVKFIEWNWLDRQTGQLNGRDKSAANIGSVLDEAATGVKVPED